MALAFPGIFIKLCSVHVCNISDILLLTQKQVESMLDKSRGTYIVGHIMVLYSLHWTNKGFFFKLLIANLFPHPTLIEHRLKWTSEEGANPSTPYVLESNIDL